MKRFFSLLLISVFILTVSYNVSGQISYTSADYANAGDSYLLSQALANPFDDYAATGPDFTWNFSSLVPLSQEDRVFLDPDDAGYELAWVTNCILTTGGIFTCGAEWDANTNLALAEAPNELFSDLIDLPIELTDVVRHYNKTTDALTEPILGVTINNDLVPLPVTTDWVIPDTIFRFPLEYNDVDISNSQFITDLNGLGIDFYYSTAQERINTVEGWGSLTTPFATFPNTLKVKTVINRSDSVSFSGINLPLPLPPTILYQWFSLDYGIPVMVASGSDLFGVEVITEVEYIDEPLCIDPTPIFLYNPLVPVSDPVTGSADVSFTNLSITADSYSWDFGDGGTSIETSPIHTFDAPGLYTVSLTACNSDCDPVSCVTLELPVLVVDTTAVIANFLAIPPSACPGADIVFQNLAVNADSYEWDFGDGDVSVETSPTHSYDLPGDYNVVLIATNEFTADTTEQTISIDAAPVLSLSNDTTILSGTSAFLSATSDVDPALYNWGLDFSLSCLFCQDPLATPASTTTYNVTASNLCGSAEGSITVTVVESLCNETTAPTGLAYTVSSPTSVMLMWDAIPGATQYHLKGKRSDSDFFGNRFSNDSNLLIEELMPGTYDWKVRALCESGAITPFSDLSAFALMARLADSKSEKNITVYPNPVSEVLTFTVEGFTGKDLEIRISDVLGRNWYSESLEELLPVQGFEIPVPQDQASGINFIQILASGKLHSAPFLIAR